MKPESALPASFPSSLLKASLHCLGPGHAAQSCRAFALPAGVVRFYAPETRPAPWLVLVGRSAPRWLAPTPVDNPRAFSAEGSVPEQLNPILAAEVAGARRWLEWKRAET